jgi:hypothetical protein
MTVPGAPWSIARPGLRRAVLAATVVADIELQPQDQGVTVLGPVAVELPWAELAGAVADLEDAHPDVPTRVTAWLRTREVLARLGPVELARRARPLGLAVAAHPAPPPGWARVQVPGGALHLGRGVVGVGVGVGVGAGAGADGDRVEPLVDAALMAGGAAPDVWWPSACTYLERMGTIAAERLPRLTAPTASAAAVLRPIGGLDVVTLLGSRVLRAALAGADGTGMRAVAVPMRERGWVDLRGIDPAFAPAAAAATDTPARGFPRPVLVTADEVCLAPVVDAVDLAALVLRDSAPAGFPGSAR